MIWKFFNVKTIIILLLSSGLLTIATTIIVYTTHSHIHLSGDIDNNLFGQFGEFIGGVVGTTFNLVAIGLLWLTYKEQQKELKETKELTKTQINLSLKPDLFAIDSNFKIFSELDMSGQSFPLEFTSEDTFNENSPPPFVKIANVGVAVAKYIDYSWSFDLSEIINYIKTNYDTDDFELMVDTDRPIAKIGLKNQPTTYINYFVEDRFDVLLPYKSSSDVKQITFPETYLTCYSIAYHLFVTSKSKLNDQLFIYNFPKCALKIKYLDIADNAHQKKFSFKIDFGYLYTKVQNNFEKMSEGTFIGVEEKKTSMPNYVNKIKLSEL